MAQDAVSSEDSRLQPSIMARPVGRDAVQTVIGVGPGDRGPWPLVTGIPNADTDMVGPPAQYLAVAAWAAWTEVTVVGVAYRGRIPLENIKVDFEVEPLSGSNTAGFGVRKLVTLMGRISEEERVRLQRAAEYCPVGQALTKGAVQVTDQIQWRSGEVVECNLDTEEVQPLEGELPAITPGTVHGHHLLDTKEYDEAGDMEHEGEVKVYVTCENLTRTSRWTLLAGHSSPGWVPPPFPLSHAAWAASSVATLGRLLPPVAAESHDLRVEIGQAPGGGRGQAQSNAAEGVVGRRVAVRRVVLPGSPADAPLDSVQGALLRDPISMAYRQGGVLLHDQVVVA